MPQFKIEYQDLETGENKITHTWCDGTKFFTAMEQAEMLAAGIACSGWFEITELKPSHQGIKPVGIASKENFGKLGGKK